MSQPYSEPLAEQFPAGNRIARVYEQLLALAENHLDHPWTCEITTWEDNEIEVSIRHRYPWPGTDYGIRGEIRYHSGRDRVDAALWKVQMYNSHEKTLLENWELDADIH